MKKAKKQPQNKILKYCMIALAVIFVPIVVYGFLTEIYYDFISPTPRVRYPDANAELLKRPSMEETKKEYEKMQQEVFNALSAELGPYKWEFIREGGGAGCGWDFPAGSGGSTSILPTYGFDGGISDADWPKAAEIVKNITEKYGFIAANTSLGNISGSTKYKDTYSFSTKVNTTWQIQIECRASAAEKAAIKAK